MALSWVVYSKTRKPKSIGDGSLIKTSIYVDDIEPCRQLVEGLLDRFKKQGRVARFIKKGKTLEDPRYIKRELVDEDEPTDPSDEEYE